MNLQQLMDRGGIIAVPLVKKKIEWTHPDQATGKLVTDKFDVWVKRHTFDVMATMFAGDEAEASRNARYISASIMLGKDGTEPLPVEKAKNLTPSLGVALLDAVNSVNNPPVKKSARRKNSGTSSS